jgi:putative flippase GtrA
VGLVGLSIDTGMFASLKHLGWGNAGARALSIALATCVTWRLNRRFTFQAQGAGDAFELSRYTIVVLLAQGVSYSTFLGICAAWPRLPPMFALLAGNAIAAGFSFYGQRFFTFASALAARNG